MKHPRDWDLTWFNLDFGKRWGLPICVLAVASGMMYSAIEFRYNVPVVSRLGPTITETVTAPVTETKELTHTVTETPPAVTVVNTTTAPAPAVQASTETVTKTVKPDDRRDVRTVTSTVTVTAPAEDNSRGRNLEIGRRGE